MKIGIAGFSTSGKSTLFAALTGIEPEHGAFTVKPRSGMTQVPDERMLRLRAMFNPKKYSPAQLEFLDYPSVDNTQKNEILAGLREPDGVIVLLRAFRDAGVPDPERGVDPARDWDDLQTDFMIGDLDIMEKRIDKLKKSFGKPSRTADQDKREFAVLEKLHAYLEEHRTLKTCELNADEQKTISGFRFLTLKALIPCLNVGMGDLNAPVPAGLPEGTLRLCASVERDIAQLDPAERPEFMKEFGLTESILDRLVRQTFETLDLRSFFTVGEDEVRSWTIDAGDSAWVAAGKIHSDIQRGFIRGEVTAYDDLISAGDMKAAKAANKQRLEGKEYEVKDGDIVHFRFSV